MSNGKISNDEILVSINKLDQWIEDNGWAGYDPYDIRATPLLLRLQSSNINLTRKVIRKIIFGFTSHFPLGSRKLFKVQKHINSKGMGLFAKAYLNLYYYTGNEKFKEKAIFCLNWLENNACKGYNGLGWGHNFDWQSVIFFPKGTSFSTINTIVGDAFYTAYKLLKNQEYINVCESISRHIVTDYNINQVSANEICFSYSPIDNFHVHNANLMISEFLIRVGFEINNEQFILLGKKAANYSLNEQNENGSLYYWGRIQNHYNPNHTDAYHSGFEIRALYNIWKLTGDNLYKQAAIKYYEYYYPNFIERINENIRPIKSKTKKYPIDIHACAESILVNALLINEDPRAKNILPKLCEWIIENMQSGDGYFIYQKKRELGFEYSVNIPYIRWGQAWMLLALSETLKNDLIYGE